MFVFYMLFTIHFISIVRVSIFFSCSRFSNCMTEIISLQFLTNAFERENGILVEEDTRTCLYQDITAAVKNTLYVMN